MELIVFKEDSVMGFQKGDVWKIRPSGYSKRMGVREEFMVIECPFHNQRKAKRLLKGIYVDGKEIQRRGYKFTKFPKKNVYCLRRWMERKW